MTIPYIRWYLLWLQYAPWRDKNVKLKQMIRIKQVAKIRRELHFGSVLNCFIAL